MEPSPRPQQHPRRIGNIKKNIFQATKDADYFHKLALQYRIAGNEALSAKAFLAEQTCRENVSALESELNESVPPKVMSDRPIQETLESGLKEQLAAKETECRELHQELHRLRSEAQILQNKLSISELRCANLQAELQRAQVGEPLPE